MERCVLDDPLLPPLRPPLRPGAWLEEHGDVLYRYALVQTRRPDIAQDLVQETLLAAWRGQSAFKRKASERTWLIGICRHKTLDYFRQSAREARAPRTPQVESIEEAEFFQSDGTWRSPPAAWDWDPLRQVQAEGFLAVLQQCLAALPTAQRECFELRELGEIETGDVSQLLGVSRNHLYVLLHRARLRLRRCLETHWFEGEENQS